MERNQHSELPDLVDVIRREIYKADPEANAALDSLAEQLQTAEREVERLKEYEEQWADVSSMQFLDYWQTIGFTCSAGTAIKHLLEQLEEVERDRDGKGFLRDAAEAKVRRLEEQLEAEKRQANENFEAMMDERGKAIVLQEQLEATQRILIEERRWISDARDWYRDHRSSKGGIYDEGTWGDPFAVPGEAGALPPSPVASGADSSPPVPSPDFQSVVEGYRRDQGEA